MYISQRSQQTERLSVPEALLPKPGALLPTLDHAVLNELSEEGWKRVGVMVAVMDSARNVLMLNHNGRGKNGHGVLGPLGETSQASGPIVEQPLETLYRGIREELGEEQPGDMRLLMHSEAGWTINQWPRGTAYPGEFACAIAFPVFVTDAVRTSLLTRNIGTKEVAGARFMSTDEVMATNPEDLRPGVHEWLGQLVSAKLLDTTRAELTSVDFTQIYAASLLDIEL